MKVIANGEPREIAGGTTVGQLVAALTGQESGIAVAVNGEIVPRRSWRARILADGDQVEVVTAVQGG